MRIPSGVTDQYIYFVALDPVTGDRETGLSGFTVYRSRNGGAAAAFTTPTVNETDTTNMPGVYELLLDEDMTIDAGDDSQEMVFHITQASMLPVTRTIELYRPKITAGNTLGVESDGDLTKVNTLDGHTAQTGDSFARLGAPAGASVSADIATVDSNVDAVLVDTGTTLDTKINTIDTVVDGIQTDLDNATDGLGALKTLIDTVDTVVDGIQTDLDNGTDGLGAIKTDTAAILADTGTDGVVVTGTPDVNVAQISGDATAADRLEAMMDGILVCQVNDASATTTAFAADGFTEATDDHFNGRLITFLTGALAGQQTDITDYDAAGHVQGAQTFVVTALTEAPANNDFFVIH